MKNRSLLQNLAVMIIFPVVGLITFTEGVRTVQVLGLLASGAVFGVFLSRLLMTLRNNRDAG